MPAIEHEMGLSIKEMEMALPTPIDSRVAEAAPVDALLTFPVDLEEEV